MYYWKMDDNAASTTVEDSAGSDDGTFNDASGDPNTNAHNTTGRIDGALTFDGTDDYITFSDNPGYESDTEGAIVAWIKIDSTGSYQTIYGYGDSAGTNDFLAFQTTTTEQLTINIRISGSNNRIDTIKTLNTGTWYHVAVVSDGNTNTDLYIDGQNASTTIFGGSEGKWFDDVASVAELATIGALRRSSIASYLDGSIDNVMIFDEALSDDQIQTLFNFGNLSYDEAGSLTTDQRGYEYEYDYENRIVKITKGTRTIAEFAYDALGRRVEKKDLIDPNNTRRYYHNYNWQVLTEYNGSGVFKQWYAYGNYIDEVIMMGTTGSPASARFYIHDHLYSPAALTTWTGTILERYEYDAYGNCYVLEPNFVPDSDGESNYGNPYLFTGRRVDILDSGSLKIQYNRNRYYDYYTGRWLTHDPLGITPNPQKPNRFEAIGQYKDGMNLYEYVRSNPAVASDPWGLMAPISIGIGLPAFKPPLPEPLSLDCPDNECPSGWLDPLPSTGRSGTWTASQAYWHFLWGDGASVEFNHLSTFAWKCSVPKPSTSGISASFNVLRKALIRKAKVIGDRLQPCRCAAFSSSGISELGYVYSGHVDWTGTLNVGQNDEYSTLKHRAKCCLKKICRDDTFKVKLVCRIRWDIYDLYTWEAWPTMHTFGDDYWQIVHFDKNLKEEIDL
ncbi:MAG: hypothetical protein GWN00_02735 [Aliifodinibius sp.]|nr:hypothetical protein [Fodinibius sp.]NIV10145.1 hypothetical protein [Fodinibius sp.]NIY23771.1 hypothetical protein [Fodinibius sp.]